MRAAVGRLEFHAIAAAIVACAGCARDEPAVRAAPATAPAPAPVQPAAAVDVRDAPAVETGGGSEAGSEGATMTRTADGAWMVSWRAEPEPIPANEPFTIVARVLDPAGRAPAREVTLRADAAMPHHRHGMVTVPTVTQRDDGSFLVEGMLFHMSGRWELYLDVTHGAITERALAVVEIE